MRILQGDIYWVTIGDPHPFVVVEHDSFNRGLNSVVTCQLTGSTSLAKHRGNVLLAPGEGNLREHSVVNITEIWTFYKDELGDWIGRLDPDRVREIHEGIRLLMKGYEFEHGD